MGVVVFLNMGVYSQSLVHEFSIGAGYSNQTKSALEYELSEVVKSDYGGKQQFLIWEIEKTPGTENQYESIEPITICYSRTSTQSRIAFRFHVVYSKTSIIGKVKDHHEKIKIQDEALSFTPLILLFIQRKSRPASKKVRFFFMTGLGYRYSQKHYTRWLDTPYESTVFKVGNPFNLKLGMGLHFFPVENIGIGLEAGTGMTNAEMKLIYKFHNSKLR